MGNGIKTFRVSAQETVVRDVFYIVQATSADEATNLVKEGVFDEIRLRMYLAALTGFSANPELTSLTAEMAASWAATQADAAVEVFLAGAGKHETGQTGEV